MCGLRTGLVYRNPKPYVHSIHAYFPSVAVLNNGEMLASLVLGEAFESPNLHTYISRSVDYGETWTMEGPVITPNAKGRLVSDSGRLTGMPDGEVVVLLVRHDRSQYPDEGLTNRENLGFVPTELLLVRSSDYGRTWPAYQDVMVDPEQNVVCWESKIVELPDGRLLATAWAYDETAAKDKPNQYVISKDGGKTWSRTFSTGLHGQTLAPFLLDDNRILSVYRRMDKPGLWLNMSHLKETNG